MLPLFSALCALFPARVAAPTSAPRSYVQYALLLCDTLLCEESGDPVCTLPATYFVTISRKEAQKCLVSFQDIEGYVSPLALEFVDYEPVTKFPYRTARVRNDGIAVNMRSKPTTQTGAVVAQVPQDAVLRLYGAREGEELYAGAGNVWQYVSYVSDGGSVYGYVYSPLLVCDALSPNVIEKVPEPNASVRYEAQNPRFTGVGKIVFITALCVPALIVTLYMFYRPESKRTPRHARK